MNRRRAIGALLAFGAVGGPFSVRAQGKRIPVVGILDEASPASRNAPVAAFRQGLREAGFAEGQNVALLYRWAEGRYDRLPGLAADLVRQPVSIIATGGGPRSALAAKAATTVIPIVFTIGVDPTSVGLVRSLNRPEANLTGVTMFTTVLTAKRLELLRELVPGLKVIAFLVNPGNPNAEPQIKELGAVASASRQELYVVRASTKGDFAAAFAAASRQRAGGLIVSGDPFLSSQHFELVALAARHAIPTIYQWSYIADSGGLISYGSDIADAYRKSGVYAGRILSGAKPGELPILQPTHFDLVVNLKTARTLGLSVPQSILLRADRVIE